MGTKPSAARIQKDLGVQIRRARMAAKMTQDEAAHAASIDVKRWQRLEAGSVNATVQTLHRVALALKLSFWDLVHPPKT